ncbi:MAG TPA: MFS transporter [Opitutaceae bacterium]|jgi:putative MFS transporter
MRASPYSADGEAIGRRIDALPMNAAMWGRVLLISLGALFEIYDLFLTAYLSPGLVKAGIFRPEGSGFWIFSSQALFGAVTFAGLWVGTVAFSAIADRYGRRPIFAFSLLWYTVATVAMGLQSRAEGVYLWRFIAGVGIGVELVTIDAYISEWVPKSARTRAFAFNAFVQFLGVPLAALLATLLVPRAPFGIDGWRWVAWVSATAALAVWIARRRVPESPRWLAEHGRVKEAEAILAAVAGGLSRGGARGPHALMEVESGTAGRRNDGGFAGDIEQRVGTTRSTEYSRTIKGRVVMLVIFQIFQAIGFYGFGNWLPNLLARNGASFVHSLSYSFAIALAYPLGPLLCCTFADRYEPKRQIVLASLAIAVFGIVFAEQHAAAGLIAFGLLVTFSNCAMSYAFHAYQTELFPTRIRARAVGFCYSWSRLSTVFSSFLIAFFLDKFGARGVFGFIAGSMLIVAAVIGVFGPLTRGRRLEEI